MDHLTELFCLIDNFCQVWEPLQRKKRLSQGKKSRNRRGGLSLSELMTLLVLFHQIRYRQFKMFYFNHAKTHLIKEFPGLPSYQRCVELMPRACAALTELFGQLKGRCTGLSVVESTPLAVCENLRIGRHKVFADQARRGKTSTGWFYGFKLHVIINHLGEIIGIRLTAGNVDDRQGLKAMCKSLFGKLIADKGYISKELSQHLRTQHDTQLITRSRKNMKSSPIDPFDAALLKQRSIIECVFDELKNMCQIQHTRHRSIQNFIVNLLSGLIAYCLQPNKPKLKVSTVTTAPLIPN